LILSNSTVNNNITPQIATQKPFNPAFGGNNSFTLNCFKNDKVNTAFQKLENPTLKLLFVNMISMVAPRIIIDSYRNKYAAAETTFYELYSTVVNYGIPCLIALGTASLLGKFRFFNPKGVNTKGWIDNESIKTLGNLHKDQKNSAEYAEKVLNNVEFYRGKKGWQNLNKVLKPDDLKGHAESLAKLMQNDVKPENIKKLAGTIGESIGTVDKIKVGNLNTSLENLLKNTVYLGQQLKNSNGSHETINTVVKSLTHVNNAKTIASLAIVSALGFSTQFINRWITKKRTGKDEFVGYKDFGSDNKTSEKNNNNTVNKQNTSFKGLKGLPKLESYNILPTKDQLTWVIYPLGILGRVLSVRSGDELREVSLKSAFAYLNFLIIPTFMANWAARSFGNKHVFNNKPQKPLPNDTGVLEKLKYKFNGINNLNIRSYDDIEAYSKFKAKKYVDSNKFEKLKNILSNPDPILKEIKGKTNEQKIDLISKSITKELSGIKNASTFAGILYSCLTLGIGVNVLNQIITNRKRAKQLEAQNHKQDNNAQNKALSVNNKTLLNKLYSNFYQ